MNLLHTFLKLMKQEVATESQWKNYDKTIGKLCYISAEWQENCELESTFNEIIKKSKNL